MECEENWSFSLVYTAYSLGSGEQGEMEQIAYIGSRNTGGETDGAGELSAYTKSAL